MLTVQRASWEQEVAATLDASDKMLDYLMSKAPKTQQGILFQLVQKQQVWVDSMFMAPPYLDAAQSQANKYGFVMGVCGSPDSDRPGMVTEGQVFFLIMETAGMSMQPGASLECIEPDYFYYSEYYSC